VPAVTSISRTVAQHGVAQPGDTVGLDTELLVGVSVAGGGSAGVRPPESRAPAVSGRLCLTRQRRKAQPLRSSHA